LVFRKYTCTATKVFRGWIHKEFSAEDLICMACDTALLDNWIQTFWGNIISLASRVIMSKNAQNIFWLFGCCTVWLLKLRNLHGLIIFGSDYPVTQHNFPEVWNLRCTTTETSKCALLFYYQMLVWLVCDVQILQ
jgi:hypothetical protein